MTLSLPRKTTWLPYWHTDGHGDRQRRMYGQWAPYMDLVVFADLLVQAHRRGYLNLDSTTV